MSKKDDGKYKPSLIYTSLLEECSKIRLHGIEKYGKEDDWLSTEIDRHLDAAIRHIRAVLDGSDIDDESGFMHLAHAVTNLMFEIERKKRKEKIMLDVNNTEIDCSIGGITYKREINDADKLELPCKCYSTILHSTGRILY